jgi:hypothetical protein
MAKALGFPGDNVGSFWISGSGCYWRTVTSRYRIKYAACPKSFASVPRSRRGIDAMASSISDMGNQTGAIMTIAEYLAATGLTALIVWGVLGLLMHES